MEYPASFDTPAFPAGKRIAVSRMMAIGSMVLFFVIGVLGALVWWTARSVRIDPIVIATDNVTGAWRVVDTVTRQNDLKYTKERVMQEYVVGNFIKNWFEISGDENTNLARWAECDAATCADVKNDDIIPGYRACAMYCMAEDGLYYRFVQNILPEYKVRMEGGEKLSLDMTTVDANRIYSRDDRGGLWRVSGTLRSNKFGDIDIIGFVSVGRNALVDKYSQTLGFYVSDFNVYRLDK